MHSLREAFIGTVMLIGVIAGIDVSGATAVQWEQLTVGVAAVVAIILVTRAMTRTILDMRIQSSEQMHEMLGILTQAQEKLSAALTDVAKQLSRLDATVEDLEKDIGSIGNDITNMRFDQQRHTYEYQHNRRLVDGDDAKRYQEMKDEQTK